MRCSPWGHQESDTTEWLNWSETYKYIINLETVLNFFNKYVLDRTLWKQNKQNAMSTSRVNFISKFHIFSSVAQSCPALYYSMDCSMPGLPVHHQLLEFTHAQAHWVSDAIQPPHPLLSPSPPTFNLSQHQGLLKWVSSSHQVAKVLEFQFQHQSFQWIFRTNFRIDLFDLAVQGTLKSLLQHNSKSSILWHSGFLWSNSHICTRLLEKP